MLLGKTALAERLERNEQAQKDFCTEPEMQSEFRHLWRRQHQPQSSRETRTTSHRQERALVWPTGNEAGEDEEVKEKLNREKQKPNKQNKTEQR